MKVVHIVLTDSGGTQEEAPALLSALVVIRHKAERPKAVDAGVACGVETNKDLITSAVHDMLHDHARYACVVRRASPYGDENAARRIVRICRDFPIDEAVKRHEGTACNQK